MYNFKKVCSFLCIAMGFMFFELKSDGHGACTMCDYAVETLDIASFRPTPSLQEECHDQMVKFLSDFQNDESFFEAADVLESLCAEVGSRLGSSHSDTIRSEDREYLLEMLERIDQLIAHLERGDDRFVRLEEASRQLKEYLHY